MLHIIAVSCVLYPRVFYFWLSFLAAAAATVKTLPEDRLNCNLMLFVPLFFPHCLIWVSMLNIMAH